MVFRPSKTQLKFGSWLVVT